MSPRTQTWAGARPIKQTKQSKTRLCWNVTWLFASEALKSALFSQHIEHRIVISKTIIGKPIKRASPENCWVTDYPADSCGETPLQLSARQLFCWQRLRKNVGGAQQDVKCLWITLLLSPSHPRHCPLLCSWPLTARRQGRGCPTGTGGEQERAPREAGALRKAPWLTWCLWSLPFPSLMKFRLVHLPLTWLVLPRWAR